MYIILGADQKEYGPVSADEVRRWILDGRVTGQSQVKAEGSTEWKSLSQFPEFGAALAAKSAPANQPPPMGPGSTAVALEPNHPPKMGLAITSLVMGIFSLVGCSFLTGIPAIIAGHIAHHRSRKIPQQYAGGGMAIAGLVMGYLSLAFIPIMAGLLLPALAQAKYRAQQISCVSNMKQIGLAARMWSNSHDGKLPPTFIAMSNELSSPKILVCPGDSSKTKALTWEEFGSGNLSYEYLRPGIDESTAAQTVVFRCPIHQNVGMGDGSVMQGGRPSRRFPR